MPYTVDETSTVSLFFPATITPQISNAPIRSSKDTTQNQPLQASDFSLFHKPPCISHRSTVFRNGGVRIRCAAWRTLPPIEYFDIFKDIPPRLLTGSVSPTTYELRLIRSPEWSETMLCGKPGTEPDILFALLVCSLGGLPVPE